MAVIVSPGGTVGAKIIWRNNEVVAMSPSFYYGVRQTTTDWYEGIAVKSVSVGPGQEGEVDVTCPVPADWESGMVDARVTAEGITETLWEGSNIYQIGEEEADGVSNILTDIMPAMIVVMMMAMIMPMMDEGMGTPAKGKTKMLGGRELPPGYEPIRKETV